MPLLPPCTSRVSPGASLPRSNTLIQTVKNVSGSDAACIKLQPFGSGRQWPAGVTQNCAYPPPGVSAHTWSPIFHCVTPAPSATTAPLTSRPGKSEAPGGGAYVPARCMQSGRLTPAAATRISTSPAFGCGTDRLTSFNTSGPPGWEISTAFIWSGAAIGMSDSSQACIDPRQLTVRWTRGAQSGQRCARARPMRHDGPLSCRAEEPSMEYRRLGDSGLSVSALCLGTMMFGARTGESEAKRIVAAAGEAGVNFIDTADQYAKGESERITGAAIAANRRHWILATKVANRMSPVVNETGLSRLWMMRAIDDSLQRLRTDHVDIYYLHYDDVSTPLEETLGAVADIIRSGKARYFGISNYRGWRLSLLVQVCERMGVPRPVVCQPYYNAMNRQPEVEVLPACSYYGLGVAAYSPLARGVLTGKYKLDEEPPADSRAGHRDVRMLETEFRRESLLAAQEIVDRARSKGMSGA